MSRRFLFSLLAVWVFVFAFETVLHGFLLEGTYSTLTGVFRPAEEGVALLPILLLGYLMIAASICYVVIVLGKPETHLKAAIIGTILGALLGGGTAALQSVAFPLPAWLGVVSGLGATVEFALGAVIARLVAGPR